MEDGLWLGIGSDHTDRKAETMGIALSKQLCAKVVGKTLWRLDEVARHWEQLILRAYVTIGGRYMKYQEGPLSAMRNCTLVIAGPTVSEKMCPSGCAVR